MTDQSWEHLFEVRLPDNNRQPAAANPGAGPASETTISALPLAAVAEDGTEQCSICLCEYEVGGDGARAMPCNHCFHSGCIRRWLQVHGSCPVCRFALPAATLEERSAVLGARRWVGEGDPFGGRDPGELGWRPARPGRGGYNVFEHLGIASLVL